jgi:dienelactone hydrolase
VDEQSGWRRETWRIAGGRGDFLAEAWLAQPTGPVVVAGHGAEGDRRVHYIAGIATLWARRGLSVVAADAPRHGDRADPEPLPGFLPGELRRSEPPGDPGTVSGPAAEMVGTAAAGLPSLFADSDYLDWWLADHERVIDAVQARFGSVPLGYLGVSMGAVLGVHLMAADRRIDAAVLAVGGAPPVGVEEILGEASLTARAAADLSRAASGMGDRPVLMVQADRDEVFSRASALALYDALTGRKEISFFPGTHSAWRHPGQWSRRMTAFFDETLRSRNGGEGLPAGANPPGRS